MSDHNFDTRRNEAVPVKVNRIFDSCSDKDCMSDLPVTITDGELAPEINIVRSRCASVQNICISVEPVPFNKGFYSIDLTFTFDIEILGYENASSAPVSLRGTAHAVKNCILYGSESAVKIFTSEGSTDCTEEDPPQTANLPVASVSVLEPIVLETKIGRSCSCPVPISAPEKEAKQHDSRGIYVTLGLFSVVELYRPVTVMVPTLDYNIPKKECCTESDSPCEVFERLKFPEEEFSPAGLGYVGSNDRECENFNEVITE